MNEANITCKHCRKLKQDFSYLQQKEKEIRAKFENIQKEVEDLRLKNQLLEEENKLLKETRSTPQIIETKPKTSGQAINILSQFDSIFETQGKEITELITDRDTLVNLAFSAINLAAAQENQLNSYNQAINNMISFISDKGIPTASITQELKSLGIDATSAFDLYKRKTSIQSLIPSGIDDEELIQALESLPKAHTSTKSMEIVANFVLKQIDERKELRKQLQKEQETNKKLVDTTNQIYSYFKCNDNKKIIRKVNEMKRRLNELQQTESVPHEIAAMVIQFSTRFATDKNIKNCIKRMEKWEEDRKSGIDICQEINFMLGLLTHAGLYKSINFNDSDSVDSYLMNSKNTKIEQQSFSSVISEDDTFSKSQLEKLNESLESMQAKFSKNEVERQKFIKKHLNGQLSESASWSRICSYLLSHH